MERKKSYSRFYVWKKKSSDSCWALCGDSITSKKNSIPWTEYKSGFLRWDSLENASSSFNSSRFHFISTYELDYNIHIFTANHVFKWWSHNYSIWSFVFLYKQCNIWMLVICKTSKRASNGDKTHNNIVWLSVFSYNSCLFIVCLFIHRMRIFRFISSFCFAYLMIADFNLDNWYIWFWILQRTFLYYVSEMNPTHTMRI